MNLLITPFILLSLTLSPDLIISGDRISQGDEAPFDGVLIDPANWLLLRSHMSGDRCRQAIEECAAGCEAQIDLVLSECDQVTVPEDGLLISALQGELTRTKARAEQAENTSRRWRWIAIGAGVAIASAGGVLYLTK